MNAEDDYQQYQDQGQFEGQEANNQYDEYNLIDGEQYHEKEEELPLTPGDESLDEHEQHFFDTEELEYPNSQYVLVDEKDENPNEHSQVIYDAESFREDSECDDQNVQQFDVNYVPQGAEYEQMGDWQLQEEGEDDFAEGDLIEGYNDQQQYDEFGQPYMYPQENIVYQKYPENVLANGEYRSDRNEMGEDQNPTYIEQYSQANEDDEMNFQNDQSHSKSQMKHRENSQDSDFKDYKLQKQQFLSQQSFQQSQQNENNSMQNQALDNIINGDGVSASHTVF